MPPTTAELPFLFANWVCKFPFWYDHAKAHISVSGCNHATVGGNMDADQCNG